MSFSTARLDDRQRDRATADRGVIRRSDRQAHQRQHRGHQALDLLQCQLERCAQHSGWSGSPRSYTEPARWAQGSARVGNKGFRRFLKIEADSHFAIDPDRVAAAAKFDGIYVIRTNAQISPLVMALRYRERWIVEDIFRTAKSVINTRPIFHQRDDTIRGHVFCSFLALLLRKELIDRLVAAGRGFEWADIIHDLDHLVQTDVDQGGRRLRLRAAAPGCSGAVFQAVGVALPPMIRITAQPPPASPALSSDP